jgi:hypothetical protein
MATETQKGVVPGDEFLAELEEIRERVTDGNLIRQKPLPTTYDEAAAMRRGRGGAESLPKRNYERYLRVPDAATRRLQLRKTIDEAGQDIFGGEVPAHTELDRIVSREFGVTDEEMDRSAKKDPSAESLICNGWDMSVLREGPWPFGIGTALVGEGEKLNPKRREMTLRHMAALEELYEMWGMPHVDRATLRDDVHAEADVEHSNLDADTIRNFINTPELQEAFRKAYILRIQQIQDPSRI